LGRLVCSLGFTVWAWAGLTAQTPFQLARPSIHFDSMADGLPADMIYSLARDSKERLWVGTIDGAAYSAGGKWVTVRMPQASPSNLIRAILEGRDGSLWFGTQDGGLWRLKEGVWTNFTKGTGLASARVNCLLETLSDAGEAILWVGTAGGGIARMERGTWSVENSTHGLRDDWVWKLREIQEPDGTRRIWAGTREGLSLRIQGKWHRVGREQGFQGQSVNDLVEGLTEDGRRCVWVSCWGTGLARWDFNQWTHLGLAEGCPSRYIASLCVTRNPAQGPALWVGTYDGNLAWYVGGAWHQLGMAQGYQVIGSYALLAIPGGKPTIWVGTRGAGVATLDLGGWRILDDKLGLSSSEATSFAETVGPDGKNTLWIGTNRGIVHWENGRCIQEGEAQGLRSGYINHLLGSRGKDGRPVLWAATLKGLMMREGGRWRSILSKGPFLKEAAYVLLESEDEGGHPMLWVGTEHGLGRFQDGAWTWFTPKTGMPGDLVIALCETRDRQGRKSLWIGTRGHGVGKFSGNQWTTLGPESGLPSQSVYGLKATYGTNGKPWLWAATPGGGLARLDAEDPGARWETFTTRTTPGLPSDSVIGLVLDAQGRLLVSTPGGVARLYIEERAGVPVPGRVENFTAGDGLPTNTNIANSLYRDRDGRVWVGTVKGAAVLDSALETRVPPPPRPSILSVQANHRDVPLRPGLRFGHEDRRIVVEYFLGSFHRPEDALFRTQLLGHEPEPTPWQKDLKREFTGLPAGRYTLMVWARDFDNRESEPLELPFTVLPSPWRSPWAYLAYTLLLLGLVAAWVRFRIYRLRSRNLELEAAVKQRTRVVLEQSEKLELSNQELLDLNEELKQTLAEVKTLQGLIPICAYCKKIRDDSGFWARLEQYFSQRSEVKFSHGVCPECAEELRKEIRKQ
jgi:ligand-binding sensor domain-containing protein